VTPTPQPRPPAQPSRRKRWLRRAAALAAPVVLPLGWLIADGARDDPGAADVSVILGNKVHPSGRPSQHLRERLRRGLALFEGGEVEFLIVSGGVGIEGHEEAEVMARWLVERGVPRERIVVDREGNTTWDTAHNAAAIMRERGWTSACVVSQYFHLTRSKLALRPNGVEDVRAVRAELNLTRKELYSLVREVAGLYYYALRQDV